MLAGVAPLWAFVIVVEEKNKHFGQVLRQCCPKKQKQQQQILKKAKRKRKTDSNLVYLSEGEKLDKNILIIFFHEIFFNFSVTSIGFCGRV